MRVSDCLTIANFHIEFDNKDEYYSDLVELPTSYTVASQDDGRLAAG